MYINNIAVEKYLFNWKKKEEIKVYVQLEIKFYIKFLVRFYYFVRKSVEKRVSTYRNNNSNNNNNNNNNKRMSHTLIT